MLQPPFPVTKLESVRAFIVRSVMNSRLRVKTPATATGVLPNGELSLAAVTDNWAVIRGRLAALMESTAGKHGRVAVFRHPISGHLTALQGLGFISAHFGHHQPQIRQTAASLD